MAVFCSSCGKGVAEDARFCSSCGKPVPGGIWSQAVRGSLVRPLAGRKIAGVCQGLANHYGWDANLTRVFAVLITVALIPLGLIVYALLWIVVPEESRTAVSITTVNTTS